MHCNHIQNCDNTCRPSSISKNLEWMHSFARPLGLSSFLSLSSHYTWARNHNRMERESLNHALGYPNFKKVIFRSYVEMEQFYQIKVPRHRPSIFSFLDSTLLWRTELWKRVFRKSTSSRETVSTWSTKFLKNNFFVIKMSHLTPLDLLSALLWTLDLCRYSKQVGGGG